MERDLSTFLRHARSRVSPESVGLPRGRARQVPGLRREEVAELAGISTIWYARCEAGHGRFSLPTLDRIADVLMLRRDERALFFRLARPELDGVALDDSALHHERSILLPMQRAIREIANARSDDELAAATVEAIHALAAPHGTAYWIRRTSFSERFEAVTGSHAAYFQGYEQSRQACSHVESALRDGVIVFERDLLTSPSRELRARTSYGGRSYAAIAVDADGSGWSNKIGFAQPAPGEPDDVQRAVLETIASVVALRTQRSAASA